jgi:small conductance mechanosensitive channel
MTETLETVDRAAGPVLVILIVAIVAYVAMRLIGRLATPFILRRLSKVEDDPLSRSLGDAEVRKRLATVSALVDWVFRVLIIGAAVLAILVLLDLTPVIVAILVVFAVAAVVARDVIRDYVGGLLIVLENQYAIGDWVRIGSEYGEIETLSLRRTTLRTMGGDLVTMPNGDVRVVANRTRTWARINLDIGLSNPTQVETARQLIDETGQELAADPTFGPNVLDPPRFMFVSDITDAGVRVLIWGRVRAADRFPTEGEFRRRLLAKLRDADVDLVLAEQVRLLAAPAAEVGAPA